jgi:hypothetical protein
VSLLDESPPYRKSHGCVSRLALDNWVGNRRCSYAGPVSVDFELSHEGSQSLGHL